MSNKKRGKFGLVGRVILALGSIASAANADIGKLETENRIDSPYGSRVHTFVHKPGASEGLDNYDNIFSNPIFNPSGVSSNIVSSVEDYKFQLDSRSEDSTTSVNLEMSIITQAGNSIAMDSANDLLLTLPLAQSHGYDFGNKPITCQMDTGQRYDVKKGTQNGLVTMAIAMPHLDGSFASEEVYTTPTINFRKQADLNNNGTVDPADLFLMVGNWLHAATDYATPGDISEGYLLGDIAGGGDNGHQPDGYVNLRDYARMAGEWLESYP